MNKKEEIYTVTLHLFGYTGKDRIPHFIMQMLYSHSDLENTFNDQTKYNQCETDEA